MLQNMRESFTGPFALVLLAVIGLSFVFVGLNYSFVGQGYAAKVDGETIRPIDFESRYRNELQRQPQLASLTGAIRVQLRRGLLDQMIAEQLIENFLDDNGYRVSDAQVMEAIRAIPEFQSEGRFDSETARMRLASIGRDINEYEGLMRDALRQDQLQNAIRATGVVTPADYRRYLNLVAEQRVVTVATIEEDAINENIEISDDMIAAYYDDNPTLFRIEETADVDYVLISRSEVAESIEVSEDDLQAYYENNSDRYLQEEQRRARHILILSGDDEDAAEEEAQALLARIEAGESFEALAAEHSDDTLTAASGGDFGALTRGQYQEELASVVYTMQEGEVSGPVESAFGFHVLQLDDILPPEPQPLEQVRAELTAELQQVQADSEFNTLERSLSDALFDADDIQAVAAAVGKDLQTMTGLSRQGGEPFGANQAVIDAVFDERVLIDGEMSEVTELDADQVAVFRVSNHTPASREALPDVRERIIGSLTTQIIEQRMIDRAEEMLAALAGGEEFSTAAEAGDFVVQEPQMLTRSDQAVDQGLKFEVFAAAKPTADAPVRGRARLQDGSYAVFSLDAVLPGRPESIPLAQRDAGKLQLAQQAGDGEFQAFVKLLYDNADVVVNEDVLAANDLLQ